MLKQSLAEHLFEDHLFEHRLYLGRGRKRNVEFLGRKHFSREKRVDVVLLKDLVEEGGGTFD